MITDRGGSRLVKVVFAVIVTAVAGSAAWFMIPSGPRTLEFDAAGFGPGAGRISPDAPGSWNWPAPETFREVFDRYDRDGRAPRVVEVLVDSAGSRPKDSLPGCYLLAKKGARGLELEFLCGSEECRSYARSISESGPYQIWGIRSLSPGGVWLKKAAGGITRLDVRAVSGEARLSPELWRDWVYATALIRADHGLAGELSDATRLRARGIDPERLIAGLVVGAEGFRQEPAGDRLAASILDLGISARMKPFLRRVAEDGSLDEWNRGRAAVMLARILVAEIDRGAPAAHSESAPRADRLSAAARWFEGLQLAGSSRAWVRQILG